MTPSTATRSPSRSAGSTTATIGREPDDRQLGRRTGRPTTAPSTGGQGSAARRSARRAAIDVVRHPADPGRRPEPDRPRDGAVGVVGRRRTTSTGRAGTTSSASSSGSRSASVALVVIMRVDYHRWRRYANLGLVVARRADGRWCWFPASASNVNGSSRWLGFGAFRIQPSEFAKLAVLLFAADLLARRADRGRQPQLTLRPVLVVFGVFAGADHAAAQPRHHDPPRGDRVRHAVRRGVPVKPLVGSFGAGAGAGRARRGGRALPVPAAPGLPPPVEGPAEHRLPDDPVAGRHRPGGLTGGGLGASRRSGASCPTPTPTSSSPSSARSSGSSGALAADRAVPRPRRGSGSASRSARRTASACCWRSASPPGCSSRRSSTSAPSSGCCRSPACRCRSCRSAARRCSSRWRPWGSLLNIARQAR